MDKVVFSLDCLCTLVHFGGVLFYEIKLGLKKCFWSRYNFSPMAGIEYARNMGIRYVENQMAMANESELSDFELAEVKQFLVENRHLLVNQPALIAHFGQNIHASSLCPEGYLPLGHVLQILKMASQEARIPIQTDTFLDLIGSAYFNRAMFGIQQQQDQMSIDPQNTKFDLQRIQADLQSSQTYALLAHQIRADEFAARTERI